MKNAKEFGEYTHWSGRKTFKFEKELVCLAIESGDLKDIRRYLRPLVAHWAKEFKQKEPQSQYPSLLRAGFKHLEFALKNYQNKFENKKIGYKFSTYFEWFIRQGMIEYMNSLN